MLDHEKDILSSMVLAPYIQKAYALVGVQRKVGGNQFRHCMATMFILIDYHYIDPVLLKAAIIHDLIEDYANTDLAELQQIDVNSPEVISLVLEVSRREDETKKEFYERMKATASIKARILKCADRISNLTDLHIDVMGVDKIRKYLDDTEKYIIPMAEEVNKDMYNELTDLVARRRVYLEGVDKNKFSNLIRRAISGRKKSL